MANKRSLLLFSLLLFSSLLAPLAAQPEVHPDSTVTFRLDAPKAKNVSVVSDCLLLKPDNSAFGGKTRQEPMSPDSAGIWTYTTLPLQPEVYLYRFIVDGVWKEDPVNPDSAYILLHKESVVAVGGDSLHDLFLEPQAGFPRGRLDTLEYYDSIQRLPRRILAYIPPSPLNSPHGVIVPLVGKELSTLNPPLPVLYLLHGISGDEATWLEQGRVRQVMDNMLAQGLVRPMIVVMPDCNVPNKLEPKKRTNMLRNVFNYPVLRRGDFEDAFPGMHHFVCEHYGISPHQKDHFIAGLSSGAMQAANIVREHPSSFAKVGLFSPAWMQQKRISKQTGKAVIAEEGFPPVYLLAYGQNDLFYKDGQRFAKQLQKAGFECTPYESSGGHTWRSWREYLVAFLRTL